MPFSEHDAAAHPLSLYAATKRSTELMAHSYSALYGVPTTGLRFFTVYGPWGRPDMALSVFAQAMVSGRPIEVFNHGHHQRDFTYIEDIVEGVMRASDHVATADPHWDGNAPDPATSRAPFRLYNIGSNRPIELLRYIEVLEECLGNQGGTRAKTSAARRCGGHLGRCRRIVRGGGLPTGDAGRGRRA